MDKQRARLKLVIPWAVGAVMLLLTLLLSQGYARAQYKDLDIRSTRVSEGFENLLESQLQAQIVALQRMAARWERQGVFPFEEWQADSKLYIRDMPGYQAIEWVDADFIVRWIEPLAGNESVLNMNSAFDDRRRIALERSRDLGEPVLTQSINLKQGGKGFLCYVPINDVNGVFHGFILGVFRIEDLVRNIIRDYAPVYNVVISEHDAVIYTRYPEGPHTSEYAQKRVLDMHNIQWQMSIVPIQQAVAESVTLLPEVVLVSGILIALLLVWLLFSILWSSIKANRARDIIAEQGVLLEQSNKELQTFAYAASHDMKAPLRHMMTYARFLQEDFGEDLPEEANEFITGINTSGKRLQDFIDSLLNYSQVGGGDLKISDCDLEEIIKEILSDLAEPIAEVGASVEVESLVVVQGDPILLKQVFQNLLMNAIKYRREEEPLHVKISGARLTMETYRIELVDNGTGFEAAYNERIFEPFRRLVSGNAIEGAGIGLSTVKKIIERHNGRIAAAGILGAGATFTIDLPLLQERKQTQTNV